MYEKEITQLQQMMMTPGLPSAILGSVGQSLEALMKKQRQIDTYDKRIHPTKDGKFSCYYKKPDGRYHKIIKHTREEVQAALAELMEEPQKPAAVTIASLYPAYRDALVSTGHARTAACYDADWKKYLLSSPLVQRDISTLKPSAVRDDLMALVQENGLTRRKFRDIKTVVNGILDYAVMDDIIPTNPARALHGIGRGIFAQPEEQGAQVYTEEQGENIIRTCLESFQKTRAPGYLAVVLNFLLGLRVGELSALKYEDFNFEHHILTVQRSEVRRMVQDGDRLRADGVQVVGHLKIGYKARRVAIDADTTPALVDAIRQACGSSEWLFTRPDGERMTCSSVQHALQRVCERLEISITGNHKIRKTVISKMIQSGLFSSTDIKERAGHRDFHTTQTYYANTFSDANEETAEKLGQVLSFSNFSIFSTDIEKPENP